MGNKLTLKFELQAGEDDKLFGSVTSTMIADGIESEGYKVDKKEIHLIIISSAKTQDGPPAPGW